MKWKLSSLNSPITVYYFMKLIGLAPFTVKNNRFHPPTILDKLYSVALTITYLLTVAIAIAAFLSLHDSKIYSDLANFGSILECVASVPSTCFILVGLALTYQKTIDILNKLYLINDELKTFGINETNAKFFKNLFWNTVNTNIGMITAYVVLMFVEPNWPVFVSIRYCIESWIQVNITLIFAQTLHYISQLFTLVNNKLYDMFVPIYDTELRYGSQILSVSRNPGERNKVVYESLTDSQRIRKLRSLHLELCDLVNQTTRRFAIPILMNSITLFNVLVQSSFWMYFIVKEPRQEYLAAKFGSLYVISSVFSSLLKIGLEIVTLFIIAYASKITCEQGNAARALLYEVWNIFKPYKLKNEFLLFSTQLLQKPVTVSAFGFFDLGYSYVYKMICAAVGYSIIMIQAELARPSPSI